MEGQKRDVCEGAVNVNRCGHENKRVHGQSLYERNKCTQEHLLHRRRKISATDETMFLFHFSLLAHLINHLIFNTHFLPLANNYFTTRLFT